MGLLNFALGGGSSREGALGPIFIADEAHQVIATELLIYALPGSYACFE
jgi:hypothetical protein